MSWKFFSPFLLIISSLIFQQISSLTDTINATQSIKDGETLVSSGGLFELGFFSPGNSSNRYLGLWYKNITVTTIAWVANRASPLANKTGILRVMDPGFLVLLDETHGVIWSSSNGSRPVKNPVAQLLDTGNIVVREANDENPENFVWQSFDYPTDTFLQGMKIGRNLVTGLDLYASSWKSDDDPSPGEYSHHLDPTGYPQILIKRSGSVVFRIGPWNGIRFSGAPNSREDPTYVLRFVMNENEVYYTVDTIDKSVVSRFTLNRNGAAQRCTWVDRRQEWVIYVNLPADICDTYKLCGAYGICNIGNSPSCGCLDRFVPRDPEDWVRADWTNGCVRRANLSCGGDVFLKYSEIKLPDATRSWYNISMNLDECRMECLRNCSCTAYTQLDISRGSGCLIWHEELVDIRTFSPNGQDIYIRMASSESDSKGKNRAILIASLSSMVGVFLIGLSLFLFIRKRRNGLKTKKEGNNGHDKDAELPLFDLSVISKATNHFSLQNKLGEGGFGSVYKGNLSDEEEVAIKRLSQPSGQGLEEFKNEVILIAKLQHRNLVRLLGCCIEGDEKLLIYEYMKNRSLDYFVFDENRRKLLTWPKRFDIIMGISRGLLYLHHDSRLKIIHRDLKTSNILLDENLNPKISDFGLARTFGGDQIIARTKRVMGTYGYMAPEYAIDGKFSVKSDIFSLGVVLLEIVSGKKNRDFNHRSHYHILLGHAWILWKENRALELIDECLKDTCIESQVKRCIQVGLLCVQKFHENRPDMLSVLFMLGSEGAILPEPKEPGFFMERSSSNNEQIHMSISQESNKNSMTITDLEPR